MNIVLITTDTQRKDMISAYGNPAINTPNIDRLAAEGIRFDRAYTTCPLCTPARGAIFSGRHPQLNGAYSNSIAPHANIPLMGLSLDITVIGPVIRENGILTVPLITETVNQRAGSSRIGGTTANAIWRTSVRKWRSSIKSARLQMIFVKPALTGRRSSGPTGLPTGRLTFCRK